MLRDMGVDVLLAGGSRTIGFVHGDSGGLVIQPGSVGSLLLHFQNNPRKAVKDTLSSTLVKLNGIVVLPHSWECGVDGAFLLPSNRQQVHLT